MPRVHTLMIVSINYKLARQWQAEMIRQRALIPKCLMEPVGLPESNLLIMKRAKAWEGAPMVVELAQMTEFSSSKLINPKDQS